MSSRFPAICEQTNYRLIRQMVDKGEIIIADEYSTALQSAVYQIRMSVRLYVTPVSSHHHHHHHHHFIAKLTNVHIRRLFCFTACPVVPMFRPNGGGII